MARVQSHRVRDFTGGLNLRSNQFQLAANESPEILNMDVDPRGGVRTRRGIRPYGAALGDVIHSVLQYHRMNLPGQVLVGAGSGLFLRAGVSSWTQVHTNTNAHPLDAAQMGDNMYVTNGGGSATIRWNGSTASNLGVAWSNDFDTPTTGNMPRGGCIAAHNGHMWVANTVEGGVRYPNRVRFSHPNRPEAWRQTDWFDVDPGVDGDEIVALEPFQDHLLVFKRKSVYVVFGFDWESFQLQPVSREVGAVSGSAVCAFHGGVFFFSDTAGVYLYDGKGLRWLFDPIQPALDEDDIPSHRLDEVSLGWVRNRLWASVPWAGGQRRVFVFDPTLNKSGAWTCYDAPVTLPCGFRDLDADDLWLGAVGPTLVELEVLDLPSDDWGDGDGERFIATVYRTPWVDAGEVAVRKRFRRPWFVFHGTTNEYIEVGVFRDFNGAQRRKTFYERVSRQFDGIPWDDDPPEIVPPNLWDDQPEPHLWGAEGKAHEIERGSSLGLARSVQLRFRGPQATVPWGLDNITYTFIPKKLR